MKILYIYMCKVFMKSVVRKNCYKDLAKVTRASWHMRRKKSV